ncbi:MAG: hypothetical protein ABJA67_04945 [Chthonomonadales bacterium]
MPANSTNQRFGVVVKDVLRKPLTLAIWIGGGVSAFYFQSPIPIVFAGVAQVGYIFSCLNNETYLRKLFRAKQEKEDHLDEHEIEAMLERMDFETRQRLRYILQLYKEMNKEARADDVEAYAEQELDRIAGKLAPLIKQALRLGERKQKLAKYLQNVDQRALKSYVKSVTTKIEQTADQVQKEQYQKALVARESELQTYQSIEQASERIDSQLENLEATFASWKAKVIRIKTADMTSAASVSAGLYQELDTLSSEIDMLDNSVTEALSADSATVSVSS